MFSLGSRARFVAPAVVAAAVLIAGCGGSSGHSANPATTPTSVQSQPSSSGPSQSHPSTTRSTPASSAGHAPTTTLPGADVAALKRDLDAAGSSLGAAQTALAQSDPNQTKDDEGTTP
jgi:outer membrane murein-binding lipoprotein Lpp